MAPKTSKAVSGPWKVLVGVNYAPNDRRAEPGEIVDDLPAADAPWMLEQGLIARPEEDDA